SGCSKKESKPVEKNKNNSEWFSNLDTEDVDGNKVTKEIFSNKAICKYYTINIANTYIFLTIIFKINSTSYIYTL
ncbi:hypothetical protein ACTPEM_23430, partial [Clostridioides difficile]